MSTRLKWTAAKYGFTEAEAGVLTLQCGPSSTRGEGYIASCDALGIRSGGHKTAEEAQLAIEAFAYDVLTEAVTAFGETPA